MKLSYSSRVRPAHGRQNNNNKSLTDCTSVYRSMPMGDGPTQTCSNFFGRSSDSVSCWGDVPKHSTRFVDCSNEIDSAGTPTVLSPILNSGTVSPQTDSLTASGKQNSPTKPKTPVPPPSTNTSTTPGTSNSTVGNKASGTTGREKLLEWLRASQAKRDENNRLVFTRWIDRMDNMNSMEVAAPAVNFGVGNIHHPDVQSCGAPLFQTPAPVPGLLTTPTLVLSSPVGLMTQNRMENFCQYSTPTYGTNLMHTKTNTISSTPYNSTMIPSLINIQHPSNLVQEEPSSAFMKDSPNSEISPDLHGKETICHDPASSLYGSESSNSDIPNSTENPLLIPSRDMMVTGRNETENNQETGHLSTEIQLPCAGLPPTPYYIPLPLVCDSNSPYMYYYYCYQTQQPSTVTQPTGYGGNPMFYFLQPAPHQTLCFSPAYSCAPVYNSPMEANSSLELNNQLRVGAEGEKRLDHIVQSGQMISDSAAVSPEESSDYEYTIQLDTIAPFQDTEDRTKSALEFDVTKWYNVLDDVEANGKMQTPHLTKSTDQTHLST